MTSVACPLSLSTVVVTTAWVSVSRIIFPEIDYDKVDRVRGLDITITTTAKSDEEGRALLAAFDFPFRK